MRWYISLETLVLSSGEGHRIAASGFCSGIHSAPRRHFRKVAPAAFSAPLQDQSGGAVVGATISILDTARGTTRTLTTDQSGEYNAPKPAAGTYTVSAEVQGFKTAERSGVILEVNQELRVDLTMQPGEVPEHHRE